MMDWFTDDVKQKIIAHAQEPQSTLLVGEVCGLIVDGEVIRSPNVHPNPYMGFAIDLNLWRKYKDSTQCVYHSHTIKGARTLKHADLTSANTNTKPILMWHPEAGWDYYDPLYHHPHPLKIQSDPKDLNSYLNWLWEWGRSDCGWLIYHYYLGMFDIRLKAPVMSESGVELLDPSWNKYEESLIDNGFIQVDQLKQNDIIVMNLQYPTAHHGAIVIDAENEILLHIDDPDGVSKLEKYHCLLKNKTRSIWRHPQFL